MRVAIHLSPPSAGGSITLAIGWLMTVANRRNLAPSGWRLQSHSPLPAHVFYTPHGEWSRDSLRASAGWQLSLSSCLVAHVKPRERSLYLVHPARNFMLRCLCNLRGMKAANYRKGHRSRRPMRVLLLHRSSSVPHRFVVGIVVSLLSWWAASATPDPRRRCLASNRSCNSRRLHSLRRSNSTQWMRAHQKPRPECSAPTRDSFDCSALGPRRGCSSMILAWAGVG